MDTKDWQKILEEQIRLSDLKRDFKAEGKVPTPKTAAARRRGLTDPPKPQEYIPRPTTKRELLAGVKWYRRGPRWCALCWRLFLPKHKGQIYHHNVCGAFVGQIELRKGVLNAVEFLPAQTLREIGGTILLPRAYVILVLLGLCEIRFRWRIVKWESKRLWWKMRGVREPYWHEWIDPRINR